MFEAMVINASKDNALMVAFVAHECGTVSQTTRRKTEVSLLCVSGARQQHPASANLRADHLND
jgi:hypothetical protein